MFCTARDIFLGTCMFRSTVSLLPGAFPIIQFSVAYSMQAIKNWMVRKALHGIKIICTIQWPVKFSATTMQSISTISYQYEIFKW